MTQAIGRLGSSPLTRGKRPQGTARRGRGRLIPAHAGKTSGAVPLWGAGRAHPRSRGENLPARLSDPRVAGSSPLTRGKQVTVRCARGVRGLIPAHAGKTGNHFRLFLSFRAHPRSRGENGLLPGMEPPTPGSSPLTRGKRFRQPACLRALGLIPAHAGKTAPLRRVYWSMEAHPRSRGENSCTW